MNDKTRKNSKDKPTTDPSDVKGAAAADGQMVQKEATGDTESSYTPRGHMMVMRLDRSLPLDARVIADVLYDGTINMLGQLDDKLAECVQDSLIKDANLIDPSEAKDAHQENAIEEHNVYCMTAQIANFMTVLGAAAEVILENTEKIKKGMAISPQVRSEPLATLKTCEGCDHRPSVHFDNCQIGTVVNGECHDNVGGNVQNFSNGDDEEEYDGFDGEEEVCDDCGCCGSGCMEQYCPGAEGELDCPKLAHRAAQGACKCEKCTGEREDSVNESEYASELERLIVTLRKEGNDSELILATVTDILKVYDNTHGEDVKE